jgi:branched-chain amino acid transport system substrate-binding protein
MRKLAYRILPLAAGLALLVAAGCGGDNSGTPSPTVAPTATTIEGLNAGDPIKIGAILSQSGALAAVGKAQEDGLKLVVADINAAGGIRGHQVELTVRDDGGDPTQARTVAQALVEGSGAQFVIGPVLSANALSAFPYLMEKKIPTLSIAAADQVNDPSKYPYGYTVSVTASDRATLLTKFALGFKPTKIGFDSEDTPSGDSLLQQFTKALTDQGFAAANIVVAKHAQGNTDPQPQLSQLKDGGADIIISNSQGADVPRLIRTVNTLGWNVKIIGTEAFLLPSTVDASGGADAVKNVYAPQYLNLTYPTGGQPDHANTVAFRDKVKNASGDAAASDLANYSTMADALNVIKAAVEKAGSVDPDKVKQALESLTFQGVRSNYAFTATRHSAVSGADFVVARAGTKVNGFDERVTQ